MKVITRVIAVLMLAVMLTAVMAACGESSYKDERIVGTWKQTDDIDGNWTWTFDADGKCRLVGEDVGFDSEGTYRIENETNGKIHINLTAWSEEKLFSYTCTEKVLDLEAIEYSFYCIKQ